MDPHRRRLHPELAGASVASNQRNEQWCCLKEAACNSISARIAGDQTGGRWHLQKALETRDGLWKWLQRNPNASAADRDAAQRELQNLCDAMAGR